jgi:TPR repeat protein
MYETGQGVPQDHAEAARLYRLAASQGQVEAQLNLGAKLANGDGVVVNPQAGYMWTYLAAQAGNETATENLPLIAGMLNESEIAAAIRMANSCQSDLTTCN